MNGRVYPDIMLHTQMNARWSIKNPPLATLPPRLERLIVPDKGTVWLGWDWKAMEPHLMCALSKSAYLKDRLERNVDLHTELMVDLFEWDKPPTLINPLKAIENTDWLAKYHIDPNNDPRRVFTKSGRFEIWYGGTGVNAARRAARMGVSRDVGKRLLSTIYAQDSSYAVWRRGVEAGVQRTHGRYYVSRTFMGRPRRILYSQGQAAIREALNHPLQAGCRDIANCTIIAVQRVAPWLSLVWDKHDAQYWECNEDREVETWPLITPIIEQAWDVNGWWQRFPAEYKTVRRVA